MALCVEGLQLTPVLFFHLFPLSVYAVALDRTILLKALTALPKNDFSLCLYLLPEACHHVSVLSLSLASTARRWCLPFEVSSPQTLCTV